MIFFSVPPLSFFRHQSLKRMMTSRGRIKLTQHRK
jgi:hypothetical protein